MKKTLLRNALMGIFGIIFTYIMLGVIRVTYHYNFFPVYWYSDLFLLAMIYSPILLFKSKSGMRTYAYVIFSIMMAVYILDMTYYISFGTFMHFGLLNYRKEGATAFDISYLKPSVFLTAFLFTLGYSCFCEMLIWFMSSKEKVDKIYYALSGLIIAITVIIGILGESFTNRMIFNNNKTTAKSAGISDGSTMSNFLVSYLKASAFEDFGILTFYRSDIAVNIFKDSIGDEIVPSDDPVDMNDPAYAYDSKLDASGLLEGYNVFTIMIETGMYDFITEEFTPNLYYLMSNGLNFSNNYSKNKTSTSEMIGITGSFPVNGISYNYTTGADDYIGNLKINQPYAITNMLGSSYYKSFFHDGKYSPSDWAMDEFGFYARRYVMGQIGFDSWLHEYKDVHSGEDLENAWDFNGGYEMDSDYVDIVLDDMYKTDGNFYTFWTTLSTHGPYESYLGEKNEEAFSKKLQLFEDRGYTQRYEDAYEEVYVSKYGDMDEKYYEYLKYVTCAMMDLDVAVGKIIDKFKEEGIFDKTLFVIYGDHEAYYHKSSNNTGLAAAMVGAESIYDTRQYHTALFFYNETLTDAYRAAYGLKDTDECKVTVFTSPYIIVPTILDLLGYDYDESYYYSSSFFDFKTIYDGIFYCNEYSGFFTDKMFSTAPGKYSYTDEVLTEENLKFLEEIVKQKLVKEQAISSYYTEWFHYEEASE